MSLIIHYTGDSDYKRVLHKENPFPFHAVSNGTTWKRNVTRPEKEIISLHKKGEGYKKISKAFLISQNTVAKVVQTFKKMDLQPSHRDVPGRPRKLTPRQERLLMRRV